MYSLMSEMSRSIFTATSVRLKYLISVAIALVADSFLSLHPKICILFLQK